MPTLENELFELFCRNLTSSWWSNKTGAMRAARKELDMRTEGYTRCGQDAWDACQRPEVQARVSELREEALEGSEGWALTLEQTLLQLSKLAMGSIEGYERRNVSPPSEAPVWEEFPIVPSFAVRRSALSDLLTFHALGMTDEARALRDYQAAMDKGRISPSVEDIAFLASVEVGAKEKARYALKRLKEMAPQEAN